MPKRLFLALSFLLAVGCTSVGAPSQSIARDEAPLISMLPQNTAPNEYYPDASRRAMETGRVLVEFLIGADGLPVEPITIDEERSTHYPRLLDATRKIFHRRRFVVGDGYQRVLTASVVFEIEPCGHISRPKDVNFHFDLCIPPL